MLFFPSFIAAGGGDEGRKKRALVVECVEPHANALVFTHNFDRNPFDFFGVKLSPKDFNNKAPGRAAHRGLVVDYP